MYVGKCEGSITDTSLGLSLGDYNLPDFFPLEIHFLDLVISFSHYKMKELEQFTWQPLLRKTLRKLKALFLGYYFLCTDRESMIPGSELEVKNLFHVLKVMGETIRCGVKTPHWIFYWPTEETGSSTQDSV